MVEFRRVLKNASAAAVKVTERVRSATRNTRGVTDLNRRLISSMAARRVPTWRQFKYIRTVFTAVELRTVRLASLALALAILVIVGRLWVVHVVPVPARGGEYVEAVVGSPSLPNPLFAVGSDVDSDLTRLMYAGLMAETPDGRLIPDLAESYEVSDNGLEYVFRLKDHLSWHDGEKLTVDDILFTLSVIQNSDYKSPLLGAFRGVAAERVDDRSVKFTLEKPSASFLSTLTVGILPTHIWQDVPPSGVTLAEYNLKPVGAGPYRFGSLLRDKLGGIRSYTMERFPRAATPALLDRVTFRFYPDAESAVLAVVSKQADGIGFVPVELRDKVFARHDLAKYELRLPQYTAVFLNSKNQPLFKDAAVRAALVLSAPRQKIVTDVLHGDGLLVDSPLVPGMPGYDPNLKQAAEDPAAARAMLEKAGYVLPTSTSTVRQKVNVKKITIGSGRKATTKTVPDGAPVTLSFRLTTVDRPENAQAADLLATAWRSVGFNVEVATVSAASIKRDALNTHAYDALLFGEVMGADEDPYPFWYSSESTDGGLNLALYANRSVDELLAAARQATSTEVRAVAHAEMAKKIVADAPAIFLYTSDYPYFVDKAIKGLQVDLVATPADRLTGIRDWYKKLGHAWR